MHVEDRRTRMLLLVLGHADTKHVVPAPCMALLQRPGRGGGGGLALAFASQACSISKPSSIAMVVTQITDFNLSGGCFYNKYAIVYVFLSIL